MSRDVGPYRAQELIGTGSSGAVWRAVHRRTGAVVALKRLTAVGPARAGERARLLREAALLGEIRHPHLVGLHEILDDGPDLVLVLDHLGGGSLASLLARRGRLRPGELVSVLSPVAAALAVVHDAGLVHGDISAANIVFTGTGRPVLTDLGVARVLGERGEVSATPAYVDPLVAAGAAPAPASDVFALAAVGFHALAGVAVWNAASGPAALALAVDGDIPDLDELAPDAPADLRAVLARALSRHPRHRGSAAELALDVRHAAIPEPVDLAGDGTTVHRLPAPTHIVPETYRGSGPAHAAPPARGRVGAAGHRVRAELRYRRPVLLVVLGLAVLISAAGMVGVTWNRADPPPANPPTASPSVPAPTVDEFAWPSTPADWRPVLDQLYARRGTAFATPDADLLSGVYTAGSVLGAADADQIAGLAAAGHRLAGFDPQVLTVDSVEPTGVVTATVTITDSFTAFTVAAGSSVVATEPGRADAPVQVHLRLTRQGWRIEQAERLA